MVLGDEREDDAENGMARIVRTNLVNLVAMGGGIFITGSFLFYKTVVKSSAQKAMKLSGLVSMRVPK